MLGHARESWRRNPAGFTIVELLVVIGVVGVLLAILLPTIRRARERASQTKCAAQLHQLGVALAAYAADQHGWLPAWSGWHVHPPGTSPEDDPGQAWTEQLVPWYVPPNSPAYTCPSFDASRRPVTYFLSGRWSASQARHAMRLSEVRFGPQFVLAGEMTNRHLYTPPFGDVPRTTDDCDNDDAVLPCAQFPGDDGGFLMHPGGNNLLFGDLHVAAQRWFEPAQMTFSARAMRPWADVEPPPDFDPTDPP